MSYHLPRFSTSEVCAERRDGRELVAHCGPFTAPPLQVFAPGKQMRAKRMKSLRAFDTHGVSVGWRCARTT